MTIYGADISSWQDSAVIPGHIDFTKMQLSGITFVIHRAAFGAEIDDDLALNYAEAKKAGLLVGLYHFANYLLSPTNQAALMAALLCQYPSDLPAVLDLEFYAGWGASPSGANMASWAAQYLTALDKLLGKRTMIYTNGDLAHQMLSGSAADLAVLRAHDLWFAHVDATPPTAAQMYVWTSCKLWQYTWVGDGLLYGVESKSIDLDSCDMTMDEFNQWIGKEVTTMGKWATNGLLAHYDDTHTVIDTDDLANYDGAVIWLGRVAPDVKMSDIAAVQLQTVVDAGKPALGFFTWGIDYTYGMSANQATWPQGAQDIVIRDYLDKAIFMGDPALNHKRGYSGLIIDVSQLVQVPGTKPIYLDEQWVREFAIKHIQDLVWKRYGLPVFMYFTPATFNIPIYKNSTGQQSLTEYFKTIVQDNALSTVAFAPTLGADGRPLDTDSPVKDAAGNLRMATGYWWFWLFRWGAQPAWLYYGNNAALWKALNFTGSVTPPPDDPPVTDDADLKEIRDRLLSIETQINAIVAKLAIIKEDL